MSDGMHWRDWRKVKPKHGVWVDGPRTSNKSELAFLKLPLSCGIPVLKRGWPDFALVRDGRLEVCEVKPGIFLDGDDRERLKYEQTWVMHLLHQAGVPCFVSDGITVAAFSVMEHGCLDWLVDQKMVDADAAVNLRKRKLMDGKLR